MLGWAHGGGRRVQAQTPSPDFSIEVQGANCDTRGVNPSKCQVAAGSQFTVSVSIDDLSGLPDLDADTKAGYSGFQVRLNYSAGLTLKNRTDVTEVVWPDCGLAPEVKDVGTYLTGCAIAGGANESVFTGAVVEVDFNCSDPPGSQESVTLVHGLPTITSPGDSFIVNEQASGALAEAGSESLTINCTSGVGGIAELPEVARTPLETPGSSGASYWIVAGVAAAAAASAVTLGGAARCARRRWRR